MTTISDSPLFPNDQTEYMPGYTIIISSGRYILGDCLGHGGEGSVFEIEGKPGLVAKLYHRYKINKRQLAKLKLIVNANISSPVLLAPKDLVFDVYGNIIGYTMRAASGKKLDTILIEQCNNYSRREIVTLATNITKAYQELDSNPNYQILAGDINTNNIMVYNKTAIQLVDLDSIQINEFPCPVGFPGYSLPSAMHRNYKDFLRTSDNEQFAFAVLLFFILIHKHPFDQINGEDPDENIRKLSFPYEPDPGISTNAPPKFIFRWKTLTPNLQKAFCTTFSSVRQKDFIGIPFGTWLYYLVEYQQVLEKAVKKYRLLDVYELSADAFSETRTCPACGKAYNPNGSSIFCPSCQKLDLIQKKCANPYCSTIGKVFFVPQKFSNHVNYCKDCLQIVDVKCKRCNSHQRAKKYQIHTFDVKYCSSHRGPAKGRLTKAKNKINTIISNLDNMFLTTTYNVSLIDYSITEFRKTYSNLLQDEDIDIVKPVLKQLFLYIADLSSYAYEYQSWMSLLNNSMPQGIRSLNDNLKKLRAIRDSIPTLTKKWKDIEIPFMQTFGAKYLPNQINKAISVLEKIHFKKCACCGMEERDDSYSGTMYYCSKCSTPVRTSCPRCGTVIYKPRYLIQSADKLPLLCSDCSKEYQLLINLYKESTSKDFESINNILILDFDKRIKEFKDRIILLAKKTKTFEQIGITINYDYHLLLSEFILVKSEKKYLENVQTELRNIVNINFNTSSYTELKKMKKVVCYYLKSLNEGSFVEEGKTIRFSQLAPTALALNELKLQRDYLDNEINKRLDAYKEKLIEFESYKKSLLSIDLENFSWEKRLRNMQDVTKTYTALFEEYFDIRESTSGREYIEQELKWLIQNEKNYLERTIILIKQYKFSKFVIEDCDNIKTGIQDIALEIKKLNCISQALRQKLPLLTALLKELNILKQKLELMMSIQNKSIFRFVNEYCKRPVNTWDRSKLEELTIRVYEGQNIPDEFKTIVNNFYYEKLAIITRYESISNYINKYIISIEKDFKEEYDPDYLSSTMKNKVIAFKTTGYDGSYLFEELENAQKKEDELKEKYKTSFTSKYNSWRCMNIRKTEIVISNICMFGIIVFEYFVHGAIDSSQIGIPAILFCLSLILNAFSKEDLFYWASWSALIIGYFYSSFSKNSAFLSNLICYAFAFLILHFVIDKVIIGKIRKFRFDIKDQRIFERKYY